MISGNDMPLIATFITLLDISLSGSGTLLHSNDQFLHYYEDMMMTAA